MGVTCRRTRCRNEGGENEKKRKGNDFDFGNCWVFVMFPEKKGKEKKNFISYIIMYISKSPFFQKSKSKINLTTTTGISHPFYIILSMIRFFSIPITQRKAISFIKKKRRKKLNYGVHTYLTLIGAFLGGNQGRPASYVYPLYIHT